MGELRFGVNVHAVESGTAFAGFVRRAASLGVDVLAAPDHLGAPAPFAVLAAAAALEERMRLRTYVLDVGFWNPALLAREVATLDALSGGRAELGLGAGHMRHEHNDADLPWPPIAARWRAVADTAAQVRRRLTDPAHRPRAVQDPVPVLIGAAGPTGLDVAAEHADVVGLAGAKQLAGHPAGTLTLAGAAETDAAVARVRARAGGRAYRTDLLLQAVLLDPDPHRAAAAFVAPTDGRVSAEQALATPFVLIAPDAAAAAAELARRRERYGLDEVTVHQPYLEVLGEVIAAWPAGS